MFHANEPTVVHNWSVAKEAKHSPNSTTTKRRNPATSDSCNYSINRGRTIKTATTEKNRKANVLIEGDFSYIDDDVEANTAYRSSNNNNYNYKNNNSNNGNNTSNNSCSSSNSSSASEKSPHSSPDWCYQRQTKGYEKLSNSESVQSSPLTKEPTATKTTTTNSNEDKQNAANINANGRRRDRYETKSIENYEYNTNGVQYSMNSGQKANNVTSPISSSYRRRVQQQNCDHLVNGSNCSEDDSILPLLIENDSAEAKRCKGATTTTNIVTKSISSESSSSLHINKQPQSQSPLQQQQQQQHIQRLRSKFINNKETNEIGDNVISCNNCAESSSAKFSPLPNDHGGTMERRTKCNHIATAATVHGSQESLGGRYKDVPPRVPIRNRSSSVDGASIIPGSTSSPLNSNGPQLFSSRPHHSSLQVIRATTPLSPSKITTVIRTTLVKRSQKNQEDDSSSEINESQNVTATPANDFNDNEECNDDHRRTSVVCQTSRDIANSVASAMTVNCRNNCNNRHASNNITAIHMHHQLPVGRLRSFSSSSSPSANAFTTSTTAASVSPSISSLAISSSTCSSTVSTSSGGHEVLVENVNKSGLIVTGTGFLQDNNSIVDDSSAVSRCADEGAKETTAIPATISSSSTSTTGTSTITAKTNVAALANDRKFYSLKSNLASNAVSGDRKLLCCNDDCADLPADKWTTTTTTTSRHGSQGSNKSSSSSLPTRLHMAETLADDNEADPYNALQEYLERVKHEINEVFEQYRGKRAVTDSEATTIQDATETTTTSLMTNGELDRRYTESDSGSCLRNNSGSKKLPCRSDSAAVAVSSTIVKVNEISSGSSQKDTNGHDHLVVAAAALPMKSMSSCDWLSDDNDENAKKEKELLLLLDDEETSMSNAPCHDAKNTEGVVVVVEDQEQNSSPGPNDAIGATLQTLSTPLASTSSTLKRLRKQLTASSATTKTVTSPLSFAPQSSSSSSDAGQPFASSDSDDVNIWANKFLRDLDNLMASDKPASPPRARTTERKQLNGGGVTPPTAATMMSSTTSILKPEKHATIPLQSFNLDCHRLDACCTSSPIGGYLRTLSAPSATTATTPPQSTNNNDNRGGGSISHKSTGGNNCITMMANNGDHHSRSSIGNFHGGVLLLKQQTNGCNSAVTLLDNQESGAPSTVLKIEENDAIHKSISDASKNEKQQQQQQQQQGRERQLQLESDMDTMRTTLLSQNHQLHPPATPKRERIHYQLQPTPAIVGTATATPPTSNSYTVTVNGGGSGGSAAGDSTKKGSTSTIWTSEESILRSVGAVDEDNNSTSSSACEEASGVLSSGKSGISLDSSGLDNENNESGIGTATPPKDVSFWKNVPDNESLSSLDALRKMKFQKSGSVASSDDPDLLEVLSLYDEPNGDDDDDDDGERQHVDNDEEEDEDDDDDDDDEDDDVGIDEDGGEDEGHDEFSTISYYDYEGTDGDGGSSSGDVANGGGVILRKKTSLIPSSSSSSSSSKQKCRSHSLETASLHPLAAHGGDQQHQRLLLHHYHHHQNYHSHHNQLARKLQHLKTKDKAQLCLALRQEPFQSILPPTNFHDLPSPSSASLHSGHDNLGLQELTTKSNSAPLLLKERKHDDFSGQKLTLRYSRSQSDRYLAEIEAVEACKWLRAAGFPQYAQMYEDQQFPIDLTNVAKDHTNLENDQLQSLYRRLCILNRCANMRLDSAHKTTATPQKEDSDDENFALSENWTFQPHIRRWSRIGEMGLELPAKLTIGDKTESSSKESSPDRFEDDDTYDETTGAMTASLALPADSADSTQTESSANDVAGVRLRRTGSERLKDGAKALLRRVESIKSRRRKRQNREGIVISGPQALDLSQLGQHSSLRKLDAAYSTPPSPSAVSPIHMYPKSPLLFGHELKVPPLQIGDNFLSPNRVSPKRMPSTPRSMRSSPLHFFTSPMPHLREGKSDDSSSYYSDSQESTKGGKISLRKTPLKSRRFFQRSGKVDDIGAHSDSECHQGRKFVIKDGHFSSVEMKVRKLTRGGSLNLGKDSKKTREGFRSSSFRMRTASRKDVQKTSENDAAENLKMRSPVVRWHSFQEEDRPNMVFRKCLLQKSDYGKETTEGVSFATMSCGQLQIIRKLALVILTGYMERYCPSHRSGWNWELPKFIKKIKMPDYKDKKVFGVPLLLILQRTGQTLPIAVRSAFRWLQLNALDQIGLFRKSGVKSRITKLKEQIEISESPAECMDIFDTQQAYDVADMLKQYFRDLPESLLTTKMSDTFAAVFQHLPSEVRLDAVQCAVLLLPDENREILFALLEFLTLVAANSSYNQMTANNLAVCLAPSLFHNTISTGGGPSVSASPRRRKTTGVPDVKELSEAKAAHECLAFMIDNYKQLFTASRDKIAKCNFGYMEDSKPVPLEALGEGMQFHNWRGYLYECTSATIKEGREKSRGWFTVNSLDASVEIAYKKVGDGHPLRLWRCITEVEGPPKDVLDYIIKQRASWDTNLLQSQTVKKLDERTEIFQYACDGQIPTDFCVLRSWQMDLPRGACVIVETSIDHQKARAMFGSVRGVVLASRYLIEPCGGGRSRVMHLARVDIKGKTPEWYNKSYGHICSHYLSKIRMAFRHVAEGPESKV